jgi:heat induced stress protein YflT
VSMTTRGATVVGVFDDREEARDAIQALKDDGFNRDAISILSPDKQATQDIAEQTGTHAASGAATGAVAGGVLGGLGGWLVGIGALAIPGVGPFIAAGAFATALGGAAIGAGVGAIAGALVGMGVPEEHAKYYEGEARAGKTLVTVRAEGRYDDAQRILRDQGAYDVESRERAIATGNPTLKSGSAAGLPNRAQDTMQRTLEAPVTRED